MDSEKFWPAALIEIDCIMVRRDLMSDALRPVDVAPIVPHPANFAQSEKGDAGLSTSNGNAA